MANEILKGDANFYRVIGGVTDDSNQDIVMLRVDPVTKRLKVEQSSLSKSVDSVLVYANTAKDGSGTSYVPIVDLDGHLQVDILSSITRVPSGKSVSKIGFWEDSDGNIKYIKFYDGTDVIFTLEFSNAGTASSETWSITRS